MSEVTPAEMAAIRAAANWYARLSSGAHSEADQRAWDHWVTADPLHQLAWQRIEAVSAQLARVPGRIAAPALQGVVQSRRQVVRNLVVLASVGTLGVAAWRSDPAMAWRADLHTAVGERKKLTLADGSLLLLNTDSAVDVRFDKQQRLLTLRSGEILVSTGADPLGRPFQVDTPHGRVLALGTRFTVRTSGQGSDVAVLEKAVEVSPLGAVRPQRLEAGQQVHFDASGYDAVRANDADVGAWQQGSVIAIDKPLVELLAELSRYRHGVLRCDPVVAQMKISGAFPIDNTDLALAALESSFNLQVVSRTRFWVTVVPR
jgi:transmembrane sensor